MRCWDETRLWEIDLDWGSGESALFCKDQKRYGWEGNELMVWWGMLYQPVWNGYEEVLLMSNNYSVFRIPCEPVNSVVDSLILSMNIMSQY